MDIAFPPLPPEYTRVMAMRWLALAWMLFAIGLLTLKIRSPKQVRSLDVVWWFLIGCVGVFLARMGILDRPRFDAGWMLPLLLAVVVVPLAGGLLGVRKLFQQRRYLVGVGVILTYGFCIFDELAPKLITPREHSRRVACEQNLRQIGRALFNYHERWMHLPAASQSDPPMSWRVAIAPYLDEQVVDVGYDRKQPWNNEPNITVAKSEKISRQFSCPSNYVSTDSQGRWFTAYSMPTGPHTVGENPSGTHLDDISNGDGVTNTLLIVEACGAQIVWTEPRDVDMASQPTGINLNGTKPGQSAGWLSSYHSGGTQVLLADGSVRFVSAKTDPALLKKLATVDGGEAVGDY